MESTLQEAGAVSHVTGAAALTDRFALVPALLARRNKKGRAALKSSGVVEKNPARLFLWFRLFLRHSARSVGAQLPL